METANTNVSDVVVDLKRALEAMRLRKSDQTLMLRAICLCATSTADRAAMEVLQGVSEGRMTRQAGYRRINRLWSVYKRDPVLRGIAV